MSTWTCKVHRLHRRGGLAATLAFSLSGCLDVATPATASGGSVRLAAQQVLNGASLFGGAVILRPPPGYCVDGDSLRARSPAFALIAACPLLLGQPRADAAPLLMTVTGQAHEGPLPDAAALAALVGSATVLETLTGDGLTLVHLQGGAPGPLAGSDARHWRAVMQVNGYLLSMALFAPDGSALADRAGLVLIGALAEATRAVSQNAGSDPAVAVVSAPGNAATDITKGVSGPSGRLSLAGETG